MTDAPDRSSLPAYDRRAPVKSPVLSVAKLILIALLLQAPALGFLIKYNIDAAAQRHSFSKVQANTNAIVRSIQSQTSPSAIQARNAAVDQIVLTIDCNNAFRFQAVVDGLAKQGVIKPFNVLDKCQEKK